ncbi:MAG: nickel pincer cofactor biosynthesis protein LarC [Candidatus Eremiobacteraeota bacterium]|nr:nickel pincer cofactor biosynthesis protein LarC [Candidatus Eremiobacteraeota bacterium]MBC5803876.1 nickel pincer cofactor biosynthesis protein LarC [Candidatus Eremiobacteraeota bacterium]MBC5822967.1 nickel pincer cofactor biosynthesis protein LarC [Candidatus Eremiobacteraeota bacterium]
MNVAYVEMIGGASGNMLLGAFIDAGADAQLIEAALRTIPVTGWTLERKRVVKCGIAAEHVEFRIPGEDHDAHAPAHDHRSASGRRLDEVLDIVDRSGLSTGQKGRARDVYVRLAEAEAKVHGTPVDRAHFHEVGATDAILDVASACIALDLLAVEQLTCSAFPVGRGTIAMTHGRYPNPPPATAELLRGVPTYDGGIDGEMVTTTAAAILTTLGEDVGVRPSMRAERIGYGAGRSDFPIPNVTRIAIGTRADNVEGTTFTAPDMAQSEFAGGDVSTDEICVLEANIDDMSPQRFELALERTLAAGAFDVWLAPITMKKSRPAVLFGAVAPLDVAARVAQAMLSETTTLGVRTRRERRYVLAREIKTLDTPFGPVRIKESSIDGERRRTLEYDDVARIARERNLSFAVVAQTLEDVLRAP